MRHIYIYMATSVKMQARVLTPRRVLYALPVQGEHGFRTCSCWQRGRIKPPQVGPVMCYLIVFTWKFTLLFQERDLVVQMSLRSYFCFHGPATCFNEVKMTQNVIVEGRGVGAHFQLHFSALILIPLIQLEWENIFRSQYAPLQNKCINKLVSFLQMAVFG